MIGKARIVVVIAILVVSSAAVSYHFGLVAASPSTSQMATGGQYQGEKFYGLITNDGTNISCFNQDTQALQYGGPNNAGSVTGTNATSVIQNCVNGGGVINCQGGNVYSVNIVKIPSFTTLNLGNCKLKGGYAFPHGATYGAIFTNKHFSVTTRASDSNITINGGYLIPGTSTEFAFRFSGVRYLTVNQPYCDLKGGSGYGCYLADGANDYSWLNGFQIQGPTANIAYFNYGIEVGGSPDNLAGYINNEYTWVNYPSIQGISGDCGDTNGNDYVWWNYATCATIGNTGSSSKNDIDFDNEWNANTMVPTTNVHYTGGALTTISGTPNYGIWVGAGATSIMSSIEVSGMNFSRGSGSSQGILVAGKTTGVSIHNNWFGDTAGTAIMLAWTSAGAAGGTEVGTSIMGNIAKGEAKLVNEPCGSACTVNAIVASNVCISLSGGGVCILNNAASGKTAGTWQVYGNQYDGSGVSFFSGRANFNTIFSFMNTDNTQTVLMGTVFASNIGQSSLTAGNFCPITGGGANGCNATENYVITYVPSTGEIRSLFVSIATAPGAGKSWTFTVDVNDVGSSLACTIAGASATSCSDYLHVVQVSSGQALDIAVTASGVPASSGLASFSFEMDQSP